MRLPEFSDASLPACHGLWTPADLHTLANPGALVWPSVYVKTLGVRNKLISKLYQHFRVRVTPTAYRMLCLRLVDLVRQAFQHDSAMDPRLDTGGWASPYPTGTLTSQEAPSLSRRDDASAQPREGRASVGAPCWA